MEAEVELGQDFCLVVSLRSGNAVSRQSGHQRDWEGTVMRRLASFSSCLHVMSAVEHSKFKIRFCQSKSKDLRSSRRIFQILPFDCRVFAYQNPDPKLEGAKCSNSSYLP